MIRIFRNKRLELMEQNKVFRYLKYAIGEIVLITIGILIALQIDSFYAAQNDRATEKQLLLKLKTDLQRDTTDLNRLLIIKNDQSAACSYMLELYSNPHQIITDTAKYIHSVFAPLIAFIDYNPNRSIFELAKSSGDLFTIKDQTLAETITMYFSDNSLTQHLSTTREYIINGFRLPAETYPINPARWTIQVYQSYLNDFRIENLYITLMGSYDVDIQLINEKKENAVNLMKEIDNQILQLEN